MQASVKLSDAPGVRYLLRIADTCLIHAQRLGEWCGHAPVLEEDIALTNMALDLLGQTRALLTHAGQMEGCDLDEDQLAFLRDERDYFNLTLAELPNAPLDPRGSGGDFAFTVLRNFTLSTLLRLLWERLLSSNDPDLAAIAAKALKESRYHQQHAADWVIRLGDGTAESARRMQEALSLLWPYTRELFEDDAVDEQAGRQGLGPRWSELQSDWQRDVHQVLLAAGLPIPPASRFLSSGKQGKHSEHLGYLLADMQYLQRSFPGGVW
jgi:ring-1,2-phenylacetyl-CoA epoxidase subunit PaaC